MFKFLKEKLKGAISQTAEELEEKAEDVEEIKEVEVPIEEPKKKGFFKKLFTKEKKIEDIPESELEEIPIEKIEEEAKQEKVEKTKEKKVEEKKEKAKTIIKEKVKKKEVPSIQDLIERKPEVIEKPKIETTKTEEPKVEEKIEKPKVEESKEEIKPSQPEVKTEEPQSIKEESSKEEPKVESPKEEPKKKGLFQKIKQRIVTKQINEQQFEDLFWNLEIILLENNVAVEVIEKIKSDLKANLVNQPITRGKVEETIIKTLKQTVENLFDVEKLNLLEKAKEKKPLIICFVGINGSGKTTTIAKITKLFQNNGKSVVLAAADTFRAAAIDQLQQHADNLGVKLIKHDYGSDAAAVAFDAVKHAEAKGIDIVLIDTAGRMHSNTNLMVELEKLIRVANPDLKLFVGESITGNDCTEQAKKFNESIGIDGIVLSKADIDEKGGAAISVGYVTGKPIIYLGTGQEYDDLKEFDAQLIIDSLEL